VVVVVLLLFLRIHVFPPLIPLSLAAHRHGVKKKGRIDLHPPLPLLFLSPLTRTRWTGAAPPFVPVKTDAGGIFSSFFFFFLIPVLRHRRRQSLKSPLSTEAENLEEDFPRPPH